MYGSMTSYPEYDRYVKDLYDAEQVADFERCSTMFVYGTLKKGYGNHRLLEGANYLGERVTKDRGFMGQSGCPFAYLEDTFHERFMDTFASVIPWTGIGYEPEALIPISGELYEVDFSTFLALDNLEAEGWMYHRRLIETTENETCWMYEGGRLYLNPAPVKDGVWSYGHT